MQNDKYYRSKIPLKLVLLFLVNVFLVIALELLLFYRTPLPLTPETLAQSDSSYDNCTILQQHQRGKLLCCLVETSEGDIRLIPVKVHDLFSSRGRIYKDQIISIPEDAQQTTYPIKIGIRTSTVIISPEPIPYMETQEPASLYMAIDYAATGSLGTSGTIYMIIAAILEALELALWHLLTRQ